MKTGRRTIRRPVLFCQLLKEDFVAGATVPTRDQVAPQDCWDLSSLYRSVERWEEDFALLASRIAGYDRFRGTLSSGSQVLAECLQFDCELERLSERLGTYAFLKSTEDQTNSVAQALVARYQNLSVRASQAASFVRPEILSIPADTMQSYLESAVLQDYRVLLERIIRYRPHTLSDSEERLLALQGEMSQTASKTFGQLNDADLKFGTLQNERGETVELSNATFSQLMISPSREVRKTAFHQYYAQFAAHENTLAATLAGSIHTDVYYAKARNYASSLQAALFADNVPQAVYDNLIDTVHRHLPSLHGYFELRRRAMQLEDLHHYDTYVPLLADLDQERSWDQAVQTVMASLQPLGKEYCHVLQRGLEGRWCDRYPNKGKQSGAFSCGTFDGDPYILMNYKPRVLNDLFTLTHEAGHSMHSYYSARHQPFHYYNYTIFVAEVASTFNEQLLTHYLLQSTDDPRVKAYLINHEIDSIRATIVRQTMFAEFEKITHQHAETGQPLTVKTIKTVYRGLLEQYFGDKFCIDDDLMLECFRIPHFYRGFYVYKYATGLAAAIALSRRVLSGGPSELSDYLRFLSSGCRQDPLDLLRQAGVDMSQPEPIETALDYFASLVDQLKLLLRS
ncbi:MAG: oligoendopeptidase F [Pirellulaceae bacterium]|nr:oligoendopeptidase F [Pirellulaceae bacterium]